MIDTVLLVEDHEPMNFLNKMMLADSKKVEHIDVVLNGEEAISYLDNLIQSGKVFPSVIFLDINMPRMNGWEFLEAYGHFDEGTRKNTVIIILTSSTNPADQIKGEGNPLVHLYRLKPISDELITEIEERYFSV